MEASIHAAQNTRGADLRTVEDLLEKTQGEWAQLRDGVSPGKAPLLRRLVSIEQPRARTPEPVRPQSPDIKIDNYQQRRPEVGPAPGLGEFLCRIAVQAYGRPTVPEKRGSQMRG